MVKPVTGARIIKPNTVNMVLGSKTPLQVFTKKVSKFLGKFRRQSLEFEKILQHLIESPKQNYLKTVEAAYLVQFLRNRCSKPELVTRYKGFDVPTLRFDYNFYRDYESQWNLIYVPERIYNSILDSDEYYKTIQKEF